MGKSSSSSDIDPDDVLSTSVCLPVTIDLEKHPPPQLPPAPVGLSDNEVVPNIY